ncbi:hypothetical protein H5P28_09515 [Ruficoccus amylovorans]|uniref:Uncharacterized protein n=1 Tax=Ruficoccus amylovorans TaxID=1804625 RepID=A0A842HG25_9BACT|nr:hypothetical protein [Ruficoccus amylovorans]MBC2594494.1 hypothetical protein [Ruficoccus amylovorans]
MAGLNLREWMFVNSLQDSWYMTRDPDAPGYPPQRPVRLDQAQAILDDDPDYPLYVIHVGQTGNNPPWVRLLPTPPRSKHKASCPRCGGECYVEEKTIQGPLTPVGTVLAIGGIVSVTVGIILVIIERRELPIFPVLGIAGVLGWIASKCRNNKRVPWAICWRCCCVLTAEPPVPVLKQK